MASLASKTCVPCRGGVPPLKGQELAALHKQVPEWQVVNEHHIIRQFKFPDFKQALAQVRPSTQAWFETARNFVLFANESGVYDDLLAYMKARHLV